MFQDRRQEVCLVVTYEESHYFGIGAAIGLLEHLMWDPTRSK